MSARVLIVGQGLAGTALGLEFEAAGIDFVVASAGHERAASRVAAGLVNPVTGQRWVKSARIDELLPVARERYAAWERTLGVALWHPLPLTRLFRDEAERAAVSEKIARGELTPFAATAAVTARGVAIAGAAWVDLPALLEGAARRWRGQGRWRGREVAARDLNFAAADVGWAGERFDAAILCTGSGGLARAWFDFVPFAAAKGEMLTVEGCRVAPGTALSRGTWLIAGAKGAARVGATYERGREDLELTPEARAHLLAAAGTLTGDALRVTGQSAGVRATLPDRLPVIGWHPQQARLGIFGGLGSKGTLWAPWLARIWSAVCGDATKRFPAELAAQRWARTATSPPCA